MRNRPAPALLRGFGLAALVVLASGCGTRHERVPYAAAAGLPPPDRVAEIGLTRQYRLGPGDTVNVRVYRAAELSGEHQIDEEGRIDMPLIGSTQALGTTPAELAATIERDLRAYYENPQVDIAIKDARGRRVTIDGAVRTPGIYPVDADTTLLRALTLAQGTTEYADDNRVVIFRTIDGQRQAAAFDLAAIRRGQAADPQIYGSDIIVVDGDDLRSALRDVLQALPILAIFQPF